MDAFFASVEQLTRPSLRGRPVLVGGLCGRGVMTAASYETRVCGARSAMPIHQARRLIGVTAVVLPPRGVVYGVASRRVFDTVRVVVPVVEQLSFDEAFGEPPELVGASACDVECATRPAWSPQSAPARASRSPRSRRVWRSPTGSGWSTAPRRSRCWAALRCADSGGSGRWQRRS